MTARDAVEVEPRGVGLWQVRLRLGFAGGYVNAWIGLDDAGRGTIVDCGLQRDGGARWTQALGFAGVRPDQVDRIVVTHFHPDHIGGASALQTLTGAPVLATPVTIRDTPVVWGPNRGTMFREIGAMLLRNGMPGGQLDQRDADDPGDAFSVPLPDRWQPIESGDTLRFGGAVWTVVPTPGHADGHLVLVDAAAGRLIAGDHVLERISPAVGRWPDAHVDPLGEYLQSLDRVASLGVDLVLPGHGEPFSGAPARCHALIEHHRIRLAQCAAALDRRPASAYDVARAVFGSLDDVSSARFATAEALAHLEHLRLAGTIHFADSSDGVAHYRM